MVKHPIARRSVPTPSAMRGAHEATVPAYWLGQDRRIDPAAEFLSLAECRELSLRSQGEFVERGRAFQRFDRSFDSYRFYRDQRTQDSRLKHWQAKNGALQLVDGPEPGRSGTFKYPIPPRVNPNHRGCRCGECERPNSPGAQN